MPPTTQATPRKASLRMREAAEPFQPATGSFTETELQSNINLQHPGLNTLDKQRQSQGDDRDKLVSVAHPCSNSCSQMEPPAKPTDVGQTQPFTLCMQKGPFDLLQDKEVPQPDNANQKICLVDEINIKFWVPQDKRDMELLEDDSPMKGMKRLDRLCHEERLRELGPFSLERRHREGTPPVSVTLCRERSKDGPGSARGAQLRRQEEWTETYAQKFHLNRRKHLFPVR
ncbi:hypothetical protein BTVI_43478 [Pitangus sulphuratus]|nr:hypothetical protein BTVI_43478 [Pitangus sulphuratus]